MEHPPQLNNYQVVHSTTLRFTVKADALETPITFDNLLDCILVADTAIHGFQLFDTVKIKFMELWGMAALGSPSTVGLQFFTTGTGDLDQHTDTSLGVKPAYVRAGPSSKSLASFWSGPGGVQAFLLTAPAGSIIDLHVVYRTSTSTPTAVTNPLVGAVPGEIYFRGLDALDITTTNFPPPVGIPSI